MTSIEILARLRAIQGELCAAIAGLDDEGYRAQLHQDLSPIGWHLGHCAFIENYWLREVVQGDNCLTKSLTHYYVPVYCPKRERGPALPRKEQLLAEVAKSQADNLRLLFGMSTRARAHPLMENDYLARFLVQHHCEHLETIDMARTQRALNNEYAGFEPGKILRSAPINRACQTVEAGHYWIGGEPPKAFDNELPAHRFMSGEFNIAVRPVSNAEYLRFIEDDGYRTRRYWSDVGWHWLERTGFSHPEHWRQDARASWFGIDAQGAHDLPPEDTIYGISYFEAQACAAWANGRLPHEHEWEIAYRMDILARTGRVWEWCANAFHPYAGFKPFPYDEYSLPWFDGAHHTLRGGSRCTRPDIRRASFRNFYTPDKRHIFAGLRLVF